MDEIASATEVSIPVGAHLPTSPEKRAFLAAFAAAQGEFPPILRNREVAIAGKNGAPGYKFKYAELSAIIEEIGRASCRERVLMPV